MKTRILIFAVVATLLARTTESTAATLAASSTVGVTILQSYPGMPRMDFSKAPWLDYSKLPWLKKPSLFPTDSASVTSVEGLLAGLKADVESAASGLTALTDRPGAAEQNPIETAEATSLAVDYSTLMSQDLSTLLSQDLSVSCAQLLSTSLAVPTAPPRPNWNRQDPAVIHTLNGDVVVPTYPPRTAWGNAGTVVTTPGGASVATVGTTPTVVTTPGGAVISMVPAPAQTTSVADPQALREVSRQLQVVQKDVEQLQIFLQNLNNSRPPAPLLEPTGSKQPKPGSPGHEVSDLPSDRLPSH